MSQRIFRSMDGGAYPVSQDACRGCFMNENPDKLPVHVEPIIQNADIIVRQDIEWPIPGFYIISLRDHIESIGFLNAQQAAAIGVCFATVRRALREVLGVERAQLYHEEKILRPHVHFWMLPLWPEVMQKHAIQPKIYEANVKAYIDLFRFDEESERILDYNRRMRAYLVQDSELQRYGFA